MNILGIKAAIQACDEFICLAEELIDAEKAKGERDPAWGLFGSKLSGAVRRASLDLTRTLADMRKP